MSSVYTLAPVMIINSFRVIRSVDVRLAISLKQKGRYFVNFVNYYQLSSTKVNSEHAQTSSEHQLAQPGRKSKL